MSAGLPAITARRVNVPSAESFQMFPFPEVGDVRRTSDEGESVELSETWRADHFCEHACGIYPPHSGTAGRRLVEGDEPDFAAGRVHCDAVWQTVETLG
jgi:hypothetical protein